MPRETILMGQRFGSISFDFVAREEVQGYMPCPTLKKILLDLDMQPDSLKSDSTVWFPECSGTPTVDFVLTADHPLLFVFPYKWVNSTVIYNSRNWSWGFIEDHHCKYIQNTQPLSYVEDRRVYREDYTCCNYMATSVSGDLFCIAGPNYMHVLENTPDRSNVFSAEGDFFHCTFVSSSRIVFVREWAVREMDFSDPRHPVLTTLFAVSDRIQGMDFYGDLLLAYTSTTLYFYSFAAKTLVHSWKPNVYGGVTFCDQCSFVTAACLSNDGERAYVSSTSQLFTLCIQTGVFTEQTEHTSRWCFTAIVRLDDSVAMLSKDGIEVKNATTLAHICSFRKHEFGGYVDMWPGGPGTVLLRKDSGRLHCLFGQYWLWLHTSRGSWIAALTLL